MKTTRRGFLKGLGALLAGLLAPKREAQEVQATGAGRLSVLIPENWGRSTAGDNPEFEDGNDEWMPMPIVYAYQDILGLRQTKEKAKEIGTESSTMLDDFVRGVVRSNKFMQEQYESMANLGEGFTASLLEYADSIRCGPDELTPAQKKQAWLNHVLEKASCRIFTADDDMSLVEIVYLDDEDVTDRCAAFYGTMEPGEVDGWADLFTITRQSGIGSSIAADENGYPVAVRHSGVVRWERFA